MSNEDNSAGAAKMFKELQDAFSASASEGVDKLMKAMADFHLPVTIAPSAAKSIFEISETTTTIMADGYRTEYTKLPIGGVLKMVATCSRICVANRAKEETPVIWSIFNEIAMSNAEASIAVKNWWEDHAKEKVLINKVLADLLINVIIGTMVERAREDFCYGWDEYRHTRTRFHPTEFILGKMDSNLDGLLRGNNALNETRAYSDHSCWEDSVSAFDWVVRRSFNYGSRLELNGAALTRMAPYAHVFMEMGKKLQLLMAQLEARDDYQEMKKHVYPMVFNSLP